MGCMEIGVPWERWRIWSRQTVVENESNQTNAGRESRDHEEETVDERKSP